MEYSVTAASLGLRWRLGLLALVSAVSALLSQVPFVQATDSQLHDVLTRWSPNRSVPPEVMLVDIDERSIAELGPWPWPRPVIAQLMQALRVRGARLQVWDMYFPDPAPGDPVLDEVLRSPSRDVALGQVIVVDPLVQDPPRAGRLVPSLNAPDLCAGSSSITGYFGVAETLHPSTVGHITATPDSDGRLRQVPAVICDAGKRYPQLVLAATGALVPDGSWAIREGSYPWDPDRWLERGAFKFPLDEKGRIAVPYQRPHTAWPAISASRLLDPSASLPSLQGRVVVVGATALGLADTVSSPYHPTAPGASVHAELMGAALDHAWIVSPRAPALIAGLMGALIALALTLLPLPNRRPVWFSTGLAVAVVVPFFLAFMAQLRGVLLPVAGPAVALVSYGLALLLVQADGQRRQAQRLAAHLESFLPRGLAREIAQQNPSGESLGKTCHGVLLAIRVVGLERWTGAVDTLQALALVHAISTLTDRSAGAHGGALEHVQGEILLLAWPHGHAADVSASIAAARELFRSLEPLLARNELRQCPLGVRAALETGTFLVGVAGSKSSRRPLLLGPAADTVLAMLPLCDELASPILVGPHAAQTEPVDTLRSLGHFLLPDQAEPKPLFRTDA